MPCPWRRGLGPQRGQVPVGLLGMEAVDLEEQPQGPVDVGAHQERSRRQQLEQLEEPVARADREGPRGRPRASPSVVYT